MHTSEKDYLQQSEGLSPVTYFVDEFNLHFGIALHFKQVKPYLAEILSVVFVLSDILNIEMA